MRCKPLDPILAVLGRRSQAPKSAASTGRRRGNILATNAGDKTFRLALDALRTPANTGESAVGHAVPGEPIPLAEAVNSIFKAELIRNRGPWRGIEDLEIATVEYVEWFNHRRLHGELGMVPPVEYEQDHYRHNPAPATVEAALPSLH